MRRVLWLLACLALTVLAAYAATERQALWALGLILLASGSGLKAMQPLF